MKLTNVSPNLYRMNGSIYYGRKWIQGKLITRSLKTKDRAVANAKLKKWLTSMDSGQKRGLTLKGASQMFLSANKHKKDNTLKSYDWALKHLEKGFASWDKEVSLIEPQTYREFFSSLVLAPRSSNILHSVLSMVLDVAMQNDYIATNPLKSLKLKRKNVRTKPNIPTVEQAERIISDIRTSKTGHHRRETSEFLSLLFLAGIGEAEARALKWRDIDWENERIYIKRIKTGTDFYVPFYAWMDPLLQSLSERMPEFDDSENVFGIVSARIALKNVCKILKYKHFSPRSLRQSCIVRLLRTGMSPKLVAKYQGHSDGGILIMTTYSEVLSDMDDTWEKEQLAKLKG